MADSDPNDIALQELENVNDELAELETGPRAQPQILKHVLLDIERREFIAALKQANGVGVKAAYLLGISRDKYNRRMNFFGLAAKDWRRQPS